MPMPISARAGSPSRLAVQRLRAHVRRLARVQSATVCHVEFFLEEFTARATSSSATRRYSASSRNLPACCRAVRSKRCCWRLQLDEMAEQFDDGVGTHRSRCRSLRRATSRPTSRRVSDRTSVSGRSSSSIDRQRAGPTGADTDAGHRCSRMMKGPAEAWGYGHLHRFLHRGFHAFAGMRGARRLPRDDQASRIRHSIDGLFARRSGSVQAGR